MALMRYVGPYDEVAVTVAGVGMGIVEKGGSLSIADDLASQVEWSEHWEKASDSPVKRSDKKNERDEA